MNIIEFIQDPALINGNLSPAQETALRLQYGLPLTKRQQAIAKVALDVARLPRRREHSEGTHICGRRSGKSERIAANIAVYEATFGGHEQYLAPGERGHIVLIAQDKRAARVLYRYILGKLEGSQILSQLIQDVRAEEIDLTNGLTISIFPCSFRATRGFSIPVAILDEVAFFRVEGVNVDKEVIDALRPAQATFPRSKLIKVSSPYAKQGELYRDFSTRHRRKDLLCFRLPSWEMNPSIPNRFLKTERERDPDYFEREYGAEFTDSISSAFAREAVEACVVHDRFELPPKANVRYFGAVDPSGGGPDEFTLSVTHQENGKAVQDCLRAFRSKKPEEVVEEMAVLLKSYRVSRVIGDKYSGQWVVDSFRRQRIAYVHADMTASRAFLELLPAINQGSVQLLNDRVQTAQLVALERRRSTTGKDSLGHPAGGHDDRANALALAVRLALKIRPLPEIIVL